MMITPFGEEPLMLIEYAAFFKPSNVKAYFSTRIGGVSKAPFESLNFGRATSDEPGNIDENYQRLYRAVKGKRRHLYANQVHGTQIYVDSGIESGCVGDFDAIISSYPDAFITTYHADCYPVYFASARNGVFGLAHAGWKGVYGELVKKVYMKMKEICDKDLSDLMVVVGPGICADHYEVGESLAADFREKFSTSVVLSKDGRYFLNLKECIVHTLAEVGISDEKIKVSGACTYEKSDLFYSFRRDGADAGRMLAVITAGG